MSDAFREYTRINPQDNLAQGDILESTDTGAGPWKQHLLVLTADCDLEHKKHDSRIICVPIVPQDDYLNAFTVPRIRNERIHKHSAPILDHLLSTNGPTVSEGRLTEWVNEATIEDILQTLRIPSSIAPAISEDLASLIALSRPTESLAESIDNIVASDNSGRSEEKVRGSVIRDIQNTYRRTPGDALFLSSIAPELEDGFFVYLRQLEQLGEDDIALSFTSGKPPYRRISRLRDRYVHAISQRFGMVFMSIGLPAEYETARNIHSELLTDRTT